MHINVGLTRFAFGSVGALCLNACGAVSISNCRVIGSASGGVVFEARVKNQTSRAIAKLWVIVSTTPAAGMTPKDTLYELDGAVSPGTLATLRNIESKAEAEAFPRVSIAVQLAPVTKCFLQAVEYPDGTREIYYNPI